MLKQLVYDIQVVTNYFAILKQIYKYFVGLLPQLPPAPFNFSMNVISCYFLVLET